MKTRLQTILVVCAGLALLIALANVKAPGAAMPVPNITFANLKPGENSMEQLHGKVVLLDFWATWCGPCRESIPELIRLSNKYKGRGLTVIGVSVDGPQTQQYIPDFVKKMGMTYPVVRVADIPDMSDEHGAAKYPHNSLPTLYVIDKNGMARDVYKGFNPSMRLEDVVEPLLKE